MPDKYVEHRGVRKSRSTWARELGLSDEAFRKKLKRWPLDRLLNPLFAGSTERIVCYCEECIVAGGKACQHGLKSCEERDIYRGVTK